jgi:hypothetical protein
LASKTFLAFADFQVANNSPSFVINASFSPIQDLILVSRVIFSATISFSCALIAFKTSTSFRMDSSASTVAPFDLGN